MDIITLLKNKQFELLEKYINTDSRIGICVEIYEYMLKNDDIEILERFYDCGLFKLLFKSHYFIMRLFHSAFNCSKYLLNHKKRIYKTSLLAEFAYMVYNNKYSDNNYSDKYLELYNIIINHHYSKKMQQYFDAWNTMENGYIYSDISTSIMNNNVSLKLISHYSPSTLKMFSLQLNYDRFVDLIEIILRVDEDELLIKLLKEFITINNFLEYETFYNIIAYKNINITKNLLKIYSRDLNFMWNSSNHYNLFKLLIKHKKIIIDVHLKCDLKEKLLLSTDNNLITNIK